MAAVISYGVGPGRWVEDCGRWEAGGGQWLALRTMDTAAARLGVPAAAFTTPQQHIDALSTFAGALR
jgi:hypothetical protein